MRDLLKTIEGKKKQLDAARPLPAELVKNLDNWFKVELTYTSNAIEGNTLTRSETALVVQKGLTVSGKSLVEHLEATNYALALDFIKQLVKAKRETLKIADILDLHRVVLKGVDDQNAGKFRSIEVKIAGSDSQLPSPLRVPDLMDDFIMWLHKSGDHPVQVAVDAHFKLVAIHPFVDGNGRSARLLLGLLLMQEGYPPALVQNEDRLEYIDAIRKAEQENNFDDYYKVMYQAVERSLDIYLDMIEK